MPHVTSDLHDHRINLVETPGFVGAGIATHRASTEADVADHEVAGADLPRCSNAARQWASRIIVSCGDRLGDHISGFVPNALSPVNGGAMHQYPHTAAHQEYAMYAEEAALDLTSALCGWDQQEREAAYSCMSEKAKW